jgi:hypothetical protein
VLRRQVQSDCGQFPVLGVWREYGHCGGWNRLRGESVFASASFLRFTLATCASADSAPLPSRCIDQCKDTFANQLGACVCPAGTELKSALCQAWFDIF